MFGLVLGLDWMTANDGIETKVAGTAPHSA